MIRLVSCKNHVGFRRSGGNNLATHKSAIKRARQNRVRRARNMAYKTSAKSAIREVRLAVESKSLENAQSSLSKAVSILQTIQAKGVIPKNTASRTISRLSVQVNKLAAVDSEQSTAEEPDSPPQDPPSTQP
jgi:small subunit ribosomal protein S20